MNGWTLAARRNGLRPLTATATGLLCHGAGRLWNVDYDLARAELVGTLPPAGRVDRWCGGVRLADRVLRLAPSHALAVGDDVFIARRSEVWRYRPATGRVELDCVIPDGRRALEFSAIDLGHGPQLVFGDYFDNPARGPVRLWTRGTDGVWSVLTEFAAGEIEHVHAITAIGERVYVLCGDFEHSAGIWITDRTFGTPRPLLRGEQRYRAAWIARLGERTFYATDTQLERNHVYQLCDGERADVTAHAAIDGSSIYSAQGSDCRYFSTTVEGGLPSGSRVRDMLERTRGPGIASSSATIQCLRADGTCEPVFATEKDPWPFRLAQFGTFTFPSGTLPDGVVVAYGIALRGVDGACLVFRR